jgi:hypothetical protein
MEFRAASPVEVEVVYRPDARHGGQVGCYEARLADARGYHDVGRTAAEAIGNLIITHPEAIGFEPMILRGSIEAVVRRARLKGFEGGDPR